MSVYVLTNFSSNDYLVTNKSYNLPQSLSSLVAVTVYTNHISYFMFSETTIALVSAAAVTRTTTTNTCDTLLAVAISVSANKSYNMIFLIALHRRP